MSESVGLVLCFVFYYVTTSVGLTIALDVKYIQAINQPDQDQVGSPDDILNVRICF